jgi:hypothetical protein
LVGRNLLRGDGVGAGAAGGGGVEEVGHGCD